MSDNYEKIYRVVERIPRGRVATYGQVAELAGIPGHARQVGYALHACSAEREIPWHRVINARGEISRRSDRMFEDIQRQLLEQEGLVFNASSRVSLSRHGWRPKAPTASGRQSG